MRIIFIVVALYFLAAIYFMTSPHRGVFKFAFLVAALIIVGELVRLLVHR